MVNYLVEQLILGSMLGDGHIEKPSLNGVPRFRETHCIAQREYLVWKAKILSDEFKVKIFEGKNNFGKRTVSLYTNCSHELLYFLDLFYQNQIRRKIIPLGALKRLDDFGLAVWYMDDGCYDKMSASGRACIAIHKKNKDVVSKWFVEQGLNPSFFGRRDEGKKDCVNVIFGVRDTEVLLNRIRKYMCSSMKYKFVFTDAERAKSKLMNSKRGKEYYLRNKERIKQRDARNEVEIAEKRKKYYEKNKIEIAEKRKKYYEANKVKVLKRMKLYYADGKKKKRV